MSSVRQIISDIRSMHKLLSSDALISDRVIYQEARTTSITLIRRETNLRRLWQSASLFTTLQCLEMIEVPLGECCDYTSECTIARSKLSLPKVAEGIFGLMVQFCSSVDGSKKFKEATPMRYANLKRLNLKTNNIYFWIHNNYLYVSNPSTRAVNLTAFFEEDIPNNLLYPKDCECSKEKKFDPCQPMLDKEFKCPGYLEGPVKDMVSKKLLQAYFNLPIDKTSNQNDEQSKG